MANKLYWSWEFSGSGSLARLMPDSNIRDSVLIGGSGSDGVGTFPSISGTFTDGTGSNQCNEWFHGQYVITAGSNQDLDLSGSLNNIITPTVVFTGIRQLIVALISPTDGYVVRVGPQGVTNAWQGFWGGVGATVYSVGDPVIHGKAGGTAVAVTAGTGDILRLNNPNAGSITVQVHILGTK